MGMTGNVVGPGAFTWCCVGDSKALSSGVFPWALVKAGACGCDWFTQRMPHHHRCSASDL